MDEVKFVVCNMEKERNGLLREDASAIVFRLD